MSRPPALRRRGAFALGYGGLAATQTGEAWTVDATGYVRLQAQF